MREARDNRHRRVRRRGDDIPPVSDYAHWNEDAERVWWEENKYDMQHADEIIEEPDDYLYAGSNSRRTFCRSIRLHRGRLSNQGVGVMTLDRSVLDDDCHPQAPVSVNETFDAWCDECGERLLLPGYAGGSSDDPEPDEDYDPGPEVDDEGGMSEHKYLEGDN